MRASTALQTLLLVGCALGRSVRRQTTNATSGYQLQTPPLDTPWTSKVGTDPWPAYPRPLLQRSQWQSLNGVWTYRNASSLSAPDNPPFNQTLDQSVLVPFCLESGISGIQGEYMLYSWYQTTFTVPSDWTGDSTLLNFGAIDYEAIVYVNGQRAGFHRGGYFTFTVDITQYVSDGTNELLVFAHDPTDSDPYIIPIGKQTLNPSHIFYRPCSGIWQSVWIESAPSNYVTAMNIDADMNGRVNGTISTSNNGTTPVDIKVTPRGSYGEATTHQVTSGGTFSFSVDSPQLWSPDSPNLYDLTITVGDDEISSYVGFRTVSRGMVDGVERPLLNGEFVFWFGTLDQGFWPDGLYTPPTYEAMVYDIRTLKDLGYNMLRKHIKVESDLYYAAADEMGILVIQDMPSLRPSQTRTLDNCTVVTILPDADQQAEFQRQLELLVTQKRNYPSIVAWVVYNEGWGQITEPYYPEFGLTDIVRSLDPTRLIDSTSGWYDHGAGDFSDNHHYANPQCGSPFYSIQSSPHDPSRIGFQGEFGGIGQNVSIEHLWNVQEAIDTINQTYEIDTTLDSWRYRGHVLLEELRQQIEMYQCSGGVWTYVTTKLEGKPGNVWDGQVSQLPDDSDPLRCSRSWLQAEQTTDVEGEVNGMLTYDRRVLRPDVNQWNSDLQALYDTAAARANGTMKML